MINFKKEVCHFINFFLNKSINHKNEYIDEATALPDSLIRTVSGDPILCQTAPQLLPITSFENKDLVANSINLFNQHRNFFGMELPMMQVN